MTTYAHRGVYSRNSFYPPLRGEKGFSMTELVVAISIMGVLAGIGMVSLNQFLGGAKNTLAAERQEMMNQALHRFAQQNYEMLFNAMENSAADEMVILRTLQYRDSNPNRAKIGSPYVDPRYNPLSSSATDAFRLRWTGKMYELLVPGQNGTGLLMNFEGTDFTTAFAFPPNFQMAGR